MKRIVCIIVIVCLLVLGAVVEMIYINTSIDNLLLVGQSVVENLKQDKDEYEKVKQLNEYWDERESTICLFVNHKDMELIGEQLKKAQSYLESGDKKNALFEMEQFNYAVQAFRHISQFNLQNIF